VIAPTRLRLRLSIYTKKMKNENTRLRDHVQVRSAFVLALLITGVPAAQQNFVPEEATIRETQAALFTGQLTCVQVVRAYLNRIEAYDHQGPKLNSIITINPKALEAAVEMDRLYAANRLALKPLYCIPVILKDNYDTADMPNRRFTNSGRIRSTSRCICREETARSRCADTG
jgi:Amidase